MAKINKRILFRGDAKASIGTGDLLSLIVLSKYFVNDGWECYFMVRGYDVAIDLLTTRGINNFVCIGKDVSIEEEVVAINCFIEENKITIFMLQQFENNYNEYSGILTDSYNVLIPNNGDIPDNFMMVISWDAASIKKIENNKKNNVKYLLGSEYVIIPIEIRMNMTRERKYMRKPEKLMITLGGCDENNITLEVVKFLFDNKYRYSCTIVLGQGYRYEDQLISALNDVNFSYEIKKNVPNMYEEMLDCDFAISAGGITLHEMIATKTPCLTIATVRHQIDRCEYYEDKSLACYLGYRTIDKKKFDDFVRGYGKSISILSSRTLFKTDEIVREISAEVNHAAI